MPVLYRGVALRGCRRWTAEIARVALNAQKSSGLSVGAFSSREGLDPQRLYLWRRRLRQPTPAVDFIEVPREQMSSDPIEVVLSNGRRLRAPQTISPTRLAELAAALERSC
jgi:transposase-like protein